MKRVYINDICLVFLVMYQLFCAVSCFRDIVLNLILD
jgi:hypothetical protein